MIVSKFEGTEFHKMSSAKNDDNEGKVMESVDQANAISKVDEHIKARFNMLFIKFNDLPKLLPSVIRKAWINGMKNLNISTLLTLMFGIFA